MAPNRQTRFPAAHQKARKLGNRHDSIRICSRLQLLLETFINLDGFQESFELLL